VDRAELTEVLQEVLQARRQVTDEEHVDHHAYIALQITKKERRDELWRKFRLSAVGAVAVAVVGFLVWVGGAILTMIANTSPPPGSH
jgi:preprotein translocase subunit Sss1